MRQRLIIFIYIFSGILFAASLGIVGWNVVFKRTFTQVEPVAAARSLSDECRQSIQDDGFGLVSITESYTISQVDIDIDVDCKIELASGVSFRIANSAMTIKKLYIATDTPDASATVLFDSVDLSGGTESALQVSLKGGNSLVSVQNTKINLAGSIGLAVGGKDSDTQARLLVMDSKLATSDVSEEGIILASTGLSEIHNNVFVTNNNQQDIFIISNVCSVEGNQGLTTTCIGGSKP